MKRLPEDRHYLVLDNLNLIHWVLKYLHVSVNSPHYEDLFQEGCLGLIHAASLFDETKGFKFVTFAIPSIRGYIQRYRRDKSNIIRITRTDYDIIIQILNLTNEGCSLEDIPNKIGISSIKLKELLSIYNVDSLDAEIEGKDDSEIEKGCLVSDWKNEYDDIISELTFDDALSKSLSILKEPYISMCEEWVYSALFGEKLGQEYLAQKYKVSQPQVSRILRNFKKSMQANLGMEM